MYAENLGYNIAANAIEYSVTLKFDGASVYNGGWSTMEIANKCKNIYVKLRRKDSVFDPVKQEFVWIIFFNNSLLKMPVEQENKIGFW